MIEEIKETIEKNLKGAQAFVSDPFNDGRHFEAIVVFKEFENLTLVKQHQIVMNCLKNHFETSLHALKLKTFTPKQYAAYQQEV
jgi:acid stress-induced BolA-like protein IbaG/YrbA